jgi:energy-coupling factor transport system permease protein
VFSADLYVDGDSWLHHADPRVKLAAVVMGVVAILLYQNIWIVAGALVCLQVCILSAGVARRLGWVWRRMLPLNLLIPLFVLLLQPQGEPFARLGPVALTWGAALRGLMLVLRLDGIAFIVFGWLFTTDQAGIVGSMVRLGLPYSAGLTLAISLRYIPTFYGLFASVKEAQQARALALDEGSVVQRLRNHVPILVAMIISALRTAERLGVALEARAFGLPGTRRTSYRELTFRSLDGVYLAIIVLGFAAVVVARFAFGIGGELFALRG